MSKNAKIERSQKNFIKAMKKKFSDVTTHQEKQPTIGLSAHPTLIAERERFG